MKKGKRNEIREDNLKEWRKAVPMDTAKNSYQTNRLPESESYGVVESLR